MICVWAGCDRVATRRGYCHRDYERLRRGGFIQPLPLRGPTPRRKRRLLPGEPIPTGTPNRLINDQGYVLLRWRVGVSEWVEEREHRVVAGLPAKGLEVHHLNGVRTDNLRENLQVLTAAQHRAAHGAILHLAAVAGATGVLLPSTREYSTVVAAAEESWRWIADRYQSGLTMDEIAALCGLDASNISRGLRARGVSTRKFVRPKADIPEGLIAADLLRGVPAQALAAMHGVSSGVIHRIRKERGIPALPPGRPPANWPHPTPHEGAAA